METSFIYLFLSVMTALSVLSSILTKALKMLSLRIEKDKWNLFPSLSILELFHSPKSLVFRMGLLMFWLSVVAQLWTETWHAVLLQIQKTMLLRNGEFFSKQICHFERRCSVSRKMVSCHVTTITSTTIKRIFQFKRVL